MANDSESNVSDGVLRQGESRDGLLKLGVVAAASVLVGGVAVAWWYRKIIRKLHESGENSNNPHFGIDSGHNADEKPDDF